MSTGRKAPNPCPYTWEESMKIRDKTKPPLPPKGKDSK